MGRIVCLANSYKHNERCIAGIDVETGKWVRPVSSREDRAITKAMRAINGKEPQILDVLEIPLENHGPDEGCQPENRLLKLGQWRIVDRMKPEKLLEYCKDDSSILHNHQDRVSPDFLVKYQRRDGSLCSLSTTQTWNSGMIGLTRENGAPTSKMGKETVWG